MKIWYVPNIKVFSNPYQQCVLKFSKLFQGLISLDPHKNLMRRMGRYTLPRFMGVDTKTQESQFLASNHTASN